MKHKTIITIVINHKDEDRDAETDLVMEEVERLVSEGFREGQDYNFHFTIRCEDTE